MTITKSCIHPRDILSQGEVNGRWVVEAKADPVFHPAGTLVCNPAPLGEDISLTFTAPNGKVYYDIERESQWTPRES